MGCNVCARAGFFLLHRMQTVNQQRFGNKSGQILARFCPIMMRSVRRLHETCGKER